MATIYKICRDNVLTSTSINMTEINARTTTTQYGDCEIDTSYVTLRFTTSVPSDDNFRIYYSWESIECYEYGCQYDATPIINSAFITMLAGQTTAQVEVMTYRFECCAGEGSGDVFVLDKPVAER